jgi:hypothetical protein
LPGQEYEVSLCCTVDDSRISESAWRSLIRCSNASINPGIIHLLRHVFRQV